MNKFYNGSLPKVGDVLVSMQSMWPEDICVPAGTIFTVVYVNNNIESYNDTVTTILHANGTVDWGVSWLPWNDFLKVYND